MQQENNQDAAKIAKIAKVRALRKEEMEFISKMPWDDPKLKSLYENHNENFPGRGKTSRLPGYMRAQLSAPFPAEAITSYRNSANLTTLKAQYAMERMNQVFGVLGWVAEHEVISVVAQPVYPYKLHTVEKVNYKTKEKYTKEERFKDGEVLYYVNYALVKVRVYIRQFDLYSPWQYGGATIDDYGDDIASGFKSAVTDGISKVLGNFFEVGSQIFKGDQHSQVANKQAAFTEAEFDRLEGEFISEVTGLKPNTEEAATEKPVAKKEAPADEEKKVEPEFPTDLAPFPISKLEEAPNVGAATMVFRDAGVDFEADFAEVTGNQRVTPKALKRYYVAKWGDNPKVKEEAPKAEEPPVAKEEAPKVEEPPVAKEEAPKVEEPKVEESKVEESKGLPLDTEDANNISELALLTDEIQGFMDYEEFSSTEDGWKPIWARVQELAKAGEISSEEKNDFAAMLQEKNSKLEEEHNNK